MEKFSIFKDYADLEKERNAHDENNKTEACDSTGIFSNKYITIIDGCQYLKSLNGQEYISDVYDEGFFRILAFGMINRNIEFIHKVMELDSLFKINYTCDFLMIEQGQTEDGQNNISAPIYKWDLEYIKENIDCTVELDEKTTNFCYEHWEEPGVRRVKEVLNVDSTFSFSEKEITIPELCKKFFYYLLTDIQNNPLYLRENAKYDRFLFKRVFETVSDYNFDYSDYYIHEVLYGLNYATTLSILLCDYISEDAIESDKVIDAIISIDAGLREDMPIGVSDLLYLIFENIPDQIKNEAKKKRNENSILNLIKYIRIYCGAMYNVTISPLDVYPRPYLHEPYYGRLYDSFFKLYENVKSVDHESTINKLKNKINTIMEEINENNLEFKKICWPNKLMETDLILRNSDLKLRDNPISDKLVEDAKVENVSFKYNVKKPIRNQNILKLANSNFLNDRTSTVQEKLHAKIQKRIIEKILQEE